jgi:glutamate synthase domain-containing protein 2
VTLTAILPEWKIERDPGRCIQCRVCERQCAFEAHRHDAEVDEMLCDEGRCVGCQRCAVYCPTRALTIRPSEYSYKPNANWTRNAIVDLKRQAETGGVILTGMGCDRGLPVYWDSILLNAAQVTNPSIDPLREPMELRTFLGRKPDRLEVADRSVATPIPPQVAIDTPIMFGAMSFGAISYNAFSSLARAAHECGTLFNTGEGGWPAELRRYGASTIAQCASGRFGVDLDYLNGAAIVEIKVGQGAKPGIGGHLPGEKVSQQVSVTRMIPRGTDALSPAPHHDIYSIEDLHMLIHALKEATDWQKPVSVKISAVHNCAAIASGMVRAGADMVVIDGVRGGTGAAPKIIRDNVGIPIELALGAVDTRLRAEGIRNHASLVVSGSIRNAGDVVKAVALGADAVYIGTAALMALGCTVCQKCYTGRCSWGICTQDPALVKRVNPEMGVRSLTNLLTAWSQEIKEMLGGMGINSIESLRGNRLNLRGVGLQQWELDVLGIRGAGQ